MSHFSRIGLHVIIGMAASAFLWSCTTVEAPEPATEPPQPEESIHPETPQEEDMKAMPTTKATLSEAEAEVLEMEAALKKARSLASQAERLGMKASRTGPDRWEVTGPRGTLALSEGSRLASLNGLALYLDQPFEKRKGRFALSESDAQLILPALALEPARLPRKVMLIAIDPGHGGSEEGAKNDSLSLIEKELNLDVSLRLEEHLKELGFKTVMTRYDDRVVSLEGRPDIANRAKADLFVSVHFNASLDPKSIGLETYMLTPPDQLSTADEVASPGMEAWPGNGYDAANFAMACCIQKKITAKLQRMDRGVRKARFKVLKTLNCPGVLVECGFVSNQEEGLLVRAPVYRAKLARALADAIADIATSLSPLE